MSDRESEILREGNADRSGKTFEDGEEDITQKSTARDDAYAGYTYAEISEEQQKLAQREFVLILFVLYLVAIDLPNPNYGIFRFEQFMEETVASFNGHTGSMVGQVIEWMKV